MWLRAPPPADPPFSFGHAQDVQALEEGPPTPPFLSAGGQRPGRHPTQEQGTAGGSRQLSWRVWTGNTQRGDG